MSHTTGLFWEKKDVKGDKGNLTQQVLNVNGSIMTNNLSMKTPKAHEALCKSHTPKDKTPVGLVLHGSDFSSYSFPTLIKYFQFAQQIMSIAALVDNLHFRKA